MTRDFGPMYVGYPITEEAVGSNPTPALCPKRRIAQWLERLKTSTAPLARNLDSGERAFGAVAERTGAEKRIAVPTWEPRAPVRDPETRCVVHLDVGADGRLQRHRKGGKARDGGGSRP